VGVSGKPTFPRRPSQHRLRYALKDAVDQLVPQCRDPARLFGQPFRRGFGGRGEGGDGRRVQRPGAYVPFLAAAVLDVTGSTAGVEHLPMRKGETPTRIVAAGEGWDRLDWKPEHSWQRIAQVVDWYRNPS
jgi:hypothetical protein